MALKSRSVCRYVLKPERKPELSMLTDLSKNPCVHIHFTYGRPLARRPLFQTL